MNFTINTTTNTLSSTAGMALVGKVFNDIDLDLPHHPLISSQEKQTIKTMAGLIAQGRSRYAEVDLFRNDSLFQQALGIDNVYAPETIRIYLDRLAKQSKDYVLSALEKVNQNLLQKVKMTPIKTELFRYLPVDIDVSPMDNSGTKKEGVGRTYKGHDGYAPIFSYIGSEGYMLNCELRPGTQHCQKGTPEYIERNLNMIKALAPSDPVLIRMDSGNDAFATVKVLMKSGHFFLVKRNLRGESRMRWLDIALSMGERKELRKGKVVYTGVLSGAHPKAENDDELPYVDQVYQVTIRSIDKKGNNLLFPEVESNVYWTNLPEDPQTVIDLYHDHASSEQFHSELKTDMDFERFPSGKKAVNAILLHIAMVSFNTLRYIGQKAMEYSSDLPYKHKGKRKRLRKVISDLIRISCKLVHHGNRWILRLWEQEPWLVVFRKVYLAL